VREWIERDQPDVVCLQELKAKREQVPETLCDLAGYWCYWHGASAYSGVGLHVRKERFPEPPVFAHPAFDHETRIVEATLGDLVVASVYVPNGGKDYAAKIAFLEQLVEWARAHHAAGREVVLCGDLNIARDDVDVHPKERKPGVIGQRPEERELFAHLLGEHFVDVGRRVHPDDDRMFTWWPPWRNMRQRNIGWRIDYILASPSLATRVSDCAVLADVGTSDHAPVMMTLG
jgi:exodeoxyribonuclease-3